MVITDYTFRLSKIFWLLPSSVALVVIPSPYHIILLLLTNLKMKFDNLMMFTRE